jgi:hypothetical protein
VNQGTKMGVGFHFNVNALHGRIRGSFPGFHLNAETLQDLTGRCAFGSG